MALPPDPVQVETKIETGSAPSMYPVRFASLWAGLVFVGVISVLAAVLGALGLIWPRHTVSQSEFKKALGDQNIVLIAEKHIQTEAEGAGLTVRNYKVVSQTKRGDSAVIVLSFDVVDPTGQTQRLKLKLNLSKSLYQVQKEELVP